jgi:ankyrin repeat protein
MVYILCQTLIHYLDDENALIIACKRKDPELIMVMLQAMPFNNPEVTSAVNQIDKSMNCPLSLAAELGNAEIIKKLLQLGADPNHNHIKSIPLIVAVKTKCFEGLQHLIRAGANVDAVDRLGNSVLHYAVTSEKVPIVKLILDSGAKVNVTNWWNQTPFHWAVSTSKDQINTSLRVEKLLLDFGADINATDNFGKLILGNESR